MERLDHLIARLGYGSRKSVAQWIRQGRISLDGRLARSASEKAAPDQVLIDGEPLDHPQGLTLIYHKPRGSVCSHKDSGRLVYADFPERWLRRKPKLSTIGRLDADTSGLLILTDDGQLNHALSSPKHEISKTYRVKLARPLRGDEGMLFAAGTLILDGERTPCRPAELEVLGSREALLTLREGRYHQVRRMFAATGNHVETLCRIRIGALELEQTNLAPGEYEVVEPGQILELVLGQG